MTEIILPHREIPLTQGKIALVDEEDYAFLSQFHWTAIKRPRGWHAFRMRKVMVNVWRPLYMHRVILGEPKGLLVDHRNGDGLDNRRHNLRSCTKSQNGQNRQNLQPNKSSRFLGVCKKRHNRWLVQIHPRINGTTIKINVGSFVDEEDAARAYDEMALRYFGEFAALNFKR